MQIFSTFVSFIHSKVEKLLLIMKVHVLMIKVSKQKYPSKQKYTFGGIKKMLLGMLEKSDNILVTGT